MANPSRGSPSSVQLGQAPNNWYQSRFDPVRGSYEEPISSYHGAWTEAPPEPQSLPPTSVEERRFQTLEGMALTLENKMDKFEQKLDELIREFNLPQIPPAMAPPHPPPPDPYVCCQPSPPMWNQPPPPPDLYNCYQPPHLQSNPEPISQFEQQYQYPYLTVPAPSHEPEYYNMFPTSPAPHQQQWQYQPSPLTYLQQQYQYAPYVFEEMPVRKEAVGGTYVCEDIVSLSTDKALADHVEGMQSKIDNRCDSLEGGDCKASSSDENPVIFVETVGDSVLNVDEELPASHCKNTLPKQVEISFEPARVLLQDFSEEVYKESDSDSDSPKKMSQIAVEVEVESRPQPEDTVAKETTFYWHPSELLEGQQKPQLGFSNVSQMSDGFSQVVEGEQTPVPLFDTQAMDCPSNQSRNRISEIYTDGAFSSQNSFGGWNVNDDGLGSLQGLQFGAPPQNGHFTQKENFTIMDISPTWAYCMEATKVILIGSFNESSKHLAGSNMYYIIGEKCAAAEMVLERVYCCTAMGQSPGMLNLLLTLVWDPGIVQAAPGGTLSKSVTEINFEAPPVAFIPNFLVQEKVLYPFLKQVGGSILVAKLAKERGWANNVGWGFHQGWGFHHCSAENGGGFCAYADFFLCIQYAIVRLNISSLIIIDLAVHQRNEHEIDFSNDRRVYILDIYTSQIYPSNYEAKRYINQIQYDFSKTEGYLEQLDEALAVAREKAWAKCLVEWDPGDNKETPAVSSKRRARRSGCIFWKH